MTRLPCPTPACTGECMLCDDNGTIPADGSCLDCDGSGTREACTPEAYTCRSCEGTGLTPEARALNARVEKAQRLLRGIQRRLTSAAFRFDSRDVGETEHRLSMLAGDLHYLGIECEEAADAIQGEVPAAQLALVGS